MDSALEASQKLWKSIVDLVKCNDVRDVFELTLNASASIQSIERSSPSSEEQNFDLAKLIFIRIRYVHTDPINFIS